MTLSSVLPPAPVGGTTPADRLLAGLPLARTHARSLDRDTGCEWAVDPRGLRVADLDAARQSTVLQVMTVLVRTLGPTVVMAEVYRHWDQTYLGRVAGTGGAALGWWFTVQNPVLSCDFDSDTPDLLGADVVIPVAARTAVTVPPAAG